jgi:Cu/Ag efflux protein CusF
MQSMPTIRRRALAIAPLLALAASLVCAPARAAGLGEERITALRGNVTGPVAAVDPARRTLSLRLPRGETTYAVDRKVTTLEALKVGDTVRVDYGAVIGITVYRGAGKQAAAPSTAKGPAAGEPIKGTLRVVSLNAEQQSVRLKSPRGDEQDFHVRDKADLANVRVGDRVKAVIYELSAGDVVPVAK